MNKEKVSNKLRGLLKREKLLTIGIIALLALGALGATGNLSGEGSLFSKLAIAVGLKRDPRLPAPLAPPNGTLQISKEYIYAGGRMLATEDYGVAPVNPTPTPIPTPGGGGPPTPTPTATPTPTPTPSCFVPKKERDACIIGGGFINPTTCQCEQFQE